MTQSKSLPTFDIRVRVATKLARLAEMNATSREFAAMIRVELALLRAIPKPRTDAERRKTRCQVADHRLRITLLRRADDLALEHERHRAYITRQVRGLLDSHLATTSGRLAEASAESAALLARLNRYCQRNG